MLTNDEIKDRFEKIKRHLLDEESGMPQPLDDASLGEVATAALDLVENLLVNINTIAAK